MASARQEWGAMWPLPLIGMLGYAGTSCFAYSSGVFMIYMTREFGWSRTAFSTAFMLQTFLAFILMPLVGRLIDRVGARPVAMAGILPAILGFVLLSQANGSIEQWWLLCLGQALLCALIAPTVWLTPVASRFKASRGLAVATVLTGVGVGSALWPFLATRYIEYFGWRHAFPALIATWALLLFPLVFFFFGAQGRDLDTSAKPAAAPRTAYAGRLMSRTFIAIALSGGLFSSVSFGMTLHVVPILQDNGFTLAQAAELAVITGLSAIVGRMVIGFLLDIMPTRPLAVGVFLLPLIVSLLISHADGSILIAMCAVALLGFATGAETDIVIYMLARQFEPAILGSIYGVVLAIFAGCASLGPLLASILFDLNGSYHLYLIVIVIPILIGGVLIWSVTSGASKEIKDA